MDPPQISDQSWESTPTAAAATAATSSNKAVTRFRRSTRLISVPSLSSSAIRSVCSSAIAKVENRVLSSVWIMPSIVDRIE